jgi:hypothetical protein
MVFHPVIRKILLITYAKKMLTSQFTQVKHMDFLPSGKLSNCVVLSV